MLHFGERVSEFERRGRDQPMYCRTCKQRVDGSQLDRNMNSRRRSSLRELRHNSLLLFRSSVFISAALYFRQVLWCVNLLAIFLAKIMVEPFSAVMGVRFEEWNPGRKETLAVVVGAAK